MKIPFDTNVIVDVLLRRSDFVVPADRLMGMVESARVAGCLCATTITTIDYLLKRFEGSERSRGHIRTFLALFEIAPVHRPILEVAVTSKMPDFEDAVLCESARNVGATGIVTRNERDFRRCDLRIFSPAELFAVLKLS